jgi:hypothetical protein
VVADFLVLVAFASVSFAAGFGDGGWILRRWAVAAVADGEAAAEVFSE